MSRPPVHAIGRFAGMLGCVCAAPIASLVSAFPIYTAQPEPQIDSSPSALPASVQLIALNNASSDLHARWNVDSAPPLMEPSPEIFGTMPTETSPSSTSEARYPLTIDGAPLAEPPVPDTELQWLTIGGMQYSTGLAFDANDCNAKAGVGSCGALEDAFFDLALAWTSGQMGRQDWYET